jgi:hypothetical protein
MISPAGKAAVVAINATRDCVTASYTSVLLSAQDRVNDNGMIGQQTSAVSSRGMAPRETSFTARTTAWAKRNEVIDIAVASLPALLCVLPLAAFVPIWDGRIYADCIRSAALSPSLDHLRCAGHPSLAYAAWLTLWALARPDSPVPIALGGAALLVVALAAFHRIARRLAPGPERRLEALLLTAAFGLVPQLLAAIVHTTPDLGVCVFWLLAVAALLDESVVAAALWGTAAALSKENGLLIFGLSAACWTILYITRTQLDASTKRHRVLRTWPLALPVVAYFVAERLKPANEIANMAIAWSDASLTRQFLSLSNLDNRFAAALASVLVINFAWLPSTVIVARALRKCARWIVGAAHSQAHSREDKFVLALFLVTLWALTRFRSYLNLRYFLPIAPLLLLVAWRSLGDGARTRVIRCVALGAFCVLELVSVNRTFDPMAIAIFGTFPVGDRALLHMTSLTHECCGYGRDQLAYNLEFHHLGTLAGLSYQELAPTGVPIAVNTGADWYTYGRIDPQTAARVFGVGVPVQLVTRATVAQSKVFPPELWFVSHPNFSADELNEWKLSYDSVETRRFADGAYALTAQLLRRR